MTCYAGITILCWQSHRREITQYIYIFLNVFHFSEKKRDSHYELNFYFDYGAFGSQTEYRLLIHMHLRWMWYS